MPIRPAFGIPVVGMDSPRGIADPRLGGFAQVLARADAVLLLGKRLDFTLSHLHARLPTHRAIQAVWSLLILGSLGLLVRAYTLG